MTKDTGTFNVVAQRDIMLLHSDPKIHPRIVVPSDLPGIVIFVHGVNDPGANYDVIEEGICEGLNERLDAFRLIPGVYGEAYREAHKSKLSTGDKDYKKVAEVKYDPDTYLYQRKDRGGEPGVRTHSVFIPFYWGYRAAKKEIARETPEKGGTPDGYKVKRGQYLDVHGNRLSKHFAKGGGMFNNATTSLPLMFEAGFRNNLPNKAAKLAMTGYEYSAESPHRRYMALAAERLAMLIREIRSISPDDTITVIGHSQGTLVALLAQAMLADGNPQREFEGAVIPALPPARSADCLILVDSPYSLIEPFAEKAARNNVSRYTAKSRLKTLINIVESITGKPYTLPELTELSPAIEGNHDHQGRAGKRWKGVGAAQRRERDGTLTPFTERDNRGKVYMYFCPEDETVNLLTIKGIGTLGVPDELEDRTPAMNELKKLRFFQRAWTRRKSDDEGHSVLVGQPAGYAKFGGRHRCFVNGEPISPPYAPKMYGGEAIIGSVETAGKVIPNDYAKDLLIGNPDADVEQTPLGIPYSESSNKQKIMHDFNEGKEPDDQTYGVFLLPIPDLVTGGRKGWEVYREETPNETRARIAREEKMWQKNSYHSAMLSDRDNLRRVAAFDVAIGQAKVLDDENARSLFHRLADWKMDEDSRDKIKSNPLYRSLSPAARALNQGCYAYYNAGEFPQSLVRNEPPVLVDTEKLKWFD